VHYAYIDALGPTYRTTVEAQRSVNKCARYRPPNVVEIGKMYIWGALTPKCYDIAKTAGYGH